jgi:dihydrolipoamide dehydrogenase
MAEEIYDVVFMGGGSSGYQGAIRAAQLGCRAAVIESRDLGGVCLELRVYPLRPLRHPLTSAPGQAGQGIRLQVIPRPDMGRSSPEG